MTDDPGRAGTPGLTPKQALKAAKRRRNATAFRIRQDDPESIAAHQKAQAEYLLAVQRLAVSIRPDALDIMDQWEERLKKRGD